MPRILRQILVATVVTFHAAIMLCGPCLHALPGSGHGSDYGSQAARQADQSSAKDSHNPADFCPVCHFMAQGQLPVESSSGLPAQLIAELVQTDVPALVPASFDLLSHPRAPPLATLNLS
jgi:hypothetical protein